MALLEILTIGREILDGRVIDTNSVHIADALRPLGLVPRFAQKVDDDPVRIREAFGIAAARADIILVTGGLGPTSDDLTAESFAAYLGETPVINPEALTQVEAWFTRHQRAFADVQKKQARLPPSCFVLRNEQGTAPGFGLRRPHPAHGATGREQQWFFMPGVPREMKAMLELQVLPLLPRRPSYRTHTWATHFTSEGELQSRLQSVEAALPKGFELSYRTRFPENHIALYGDCTDAPLSRAFDEAAAELSLRLGRDVFYSGPGTKVLPLEVELVAALAERNWQLATVESCTGGLVANRLTDVAGASRVFWGSWVVYDNAAKVALGVAPSIVNEHGAVSEACAVALAEAGRQQLTQAGVAHSVCVATTGIAGPDGGSPEKPVGTCFVACAFPDGSVSCERVQTRAGLPRNENKTFFAQKALDLVFRHTGD